MYFYLLILVILLNLGRLSRGGLKNGDVIILFLKNRGSKAFEGIELLLESINLGIQIAL